MQKHAVCGRLSNQQTVQVLRSGANSRDRTDDLRITNALLYQLSYVGLDEKWGKPYRKLAHCQLCALCHQHGAYSNKMRGQRNKQASEKAQFASNATVIIDVSGYKPRRITSTKWRELIRKGREADPLL